MTTPAAAARVAARRELREAARAAWESALAAVDPEAAVRDCLLLEGNRLSALGIVLDDVGDVVVLGWGKAGAAMARGAQDVVGSRVSRGLVVVPQGLAPASGLIGSIRFAESSHPVPDVRSERAGRELLDLARSVRPEDVVLCLGSGGGSSLIACPLDGLSLGDLAATTRALLASGADIRDINCVRKHLSATHGGRLAAALGGARSLTLIVSDVVGDNPATMGSGPTAPDLSTFADAQDVLARLPAGDVPAAVALHVGRGVRGEIPDTPDADDLDWDQHASVVVASVDDAVAAAIVELQERGFTCPVEECTLEGDAEGVALAHVDTALDLARGGGKLALVLGGETTVELGEEGVGGRNQHVACVAARELDAAATDGDLASCEIVVAAIATDGADGNSDAAGGLVDAGTWSRARDAGLDPDALLEAFSSHAILEASGDLIRTGPTGTNVMDLHVVLVAPMDPDGPEAVA